MPSWPLPTERIGSPPSASIFTTSAPWSARTIVAIGPDMLVVRSTTRMPARGRIASLIAADHAVLGSAAGLGPAALAAAAAGLGSPPHWRQPRRGWGPRRTAEQR